MKKLLSLIAIALLGVSTTFAQTAPATKKVKAPVAVKTQAKKTDVKVTTVKASAPVTTKKEVKKVEVAKAVAVKAAPVKKDGTPDMRYKANKDTKRKTKS